MAARTVAVIQDNSVAWTYYLELALPVVALLLLAASRDGFRAGWPLATEKLAMVAGLGLILNAGFLRSSLEARLADPSVPHAILVAWFAVALPQVVAARDRWRPGALRLRWTLRLLGAATAVVLALVLWARFSRNFYDRMENVRFTEGWKIAVTQAPTPSASAM